MKTKYTEKILYYLEGDARDEEMMDWVEEQPLLEQPDILREFRVIVSQKLGVNTFDFEDFDSQIELYEDKVLDELLAKAHLEMAQEELEKNMIKIDQTLVGVREYIINCIINKEENAEAMKELASKLISSEKETGVYEEKNWVNLPK